MMICIAHAMGTMMVPILLQFCSRLNALVCRFARRFNHEFLHKVLLSYATDNLMATRLGGLAHGNAFNIPVLM